MAKILKFKRGNTAKNNAYTGSAGELTVDTTKKTVVVHDGVTAGGSALATDVTVSTHTSRVDNPHGVSKTQVGLGNVLNVDSTNPNNIVQDSTHRFVTDSDKTNWNGKINATEKAVANGVATLDVNGKVVLTQIPDSILGQLEYMGTYSFSGGMPTATQKGQYWIASADGNGYITGDWAVWNGTSFDKVDNTDAVATVAGRTGNVVLTKNDVGLANVDNTSDANKPVSTATQTALNLKADIASPTFTGTVTAPTFSGSLSGNAATVTNGVYTTGNQTIAGVKTFSSSPVVPAPTTDFQSVPLKSTNITVNVGTGQTYTTINQALEYLSGFYPMYKQSGITATINLKAGFVMAEQVLVSGIDLGWITIVGEDAETIITHTALTTAFYGSNYPVFGVDKGGTSPVIGQLFRFNVEKVGGNKHGLMTLGAGSSADVLADKGFIGAGAYGIFAHSGSTINANNTNCSNAGAYGIFAANSSTISAVSAIVQNQTTGNARVLVSAGSTINVYGIDATGGTVPVFSQAVNTLTGSGIIYQ